MKWCVFILLTWISALPCFAQMEKKAALGLMVGIAPGIGVATPVEKVFEEGAQWGTSFSAFVGCHVGDHWVIALEPFLFFKGYGVYDPTENLFSKKITRNFFLISTSWYPRLKRDWYITSGFGMGSYTSYNKPAPSNITLISIKEGNYGNNGWGARIGLGYDLHLGKGNAYIPIGIYYYHMQLPSLKYEGMVIDNAPFQTGVLEFHIGIAIKS
ncbi:MAG: autotransporter outer membrane beta-barrel domain-containing protein [Flammeovirgaceae bacterium]|jgi:hypothetical protein|nr:autotransporter outer membrane beta-barrel domain-containing protein [Flammeovirgaceae bacterium]